jgi:hypothetical protein
MRRAQTNGCRRTNAFTPSCEADEVKNDLCYFRMRQIHSPKIDVAGGTVQRVVLDFELKKAIYSEPAKANGLSAL